MYLVDVAARLATQEHAKTHSERSSCTNLVLEKLYLLVTSVPILTSLGVAPDDLVRQRKKRSCLQRAKGHGLRFSIENHTHTMLPVSDSFLRLWDAIRDPDLGSNLDCGWAMNQREYPPIAIHKLGGHLMNLHLRDIDARMRSTWRWAKE